MRFLFKNNINSLSDNKVVIDSGRAVKSFDLIINFCSGFKYPIDLERLT